MSALIQALQVAVINAVLFVGSVVGFMWILIHNGRVRASVIAQAKSLPIPGCPVVHTGIEWAQWVPGACFEPEGITISEISDRSDPATVYEGILFGYALWKAGETFITRMRADDNRSLASNWRPTLYSVVLSDNLLYFFLCVHA